MKSATSTTLSTFAALATGLLATVAFVALQKDAQRAEESHASAPFPTPESSSFVASGGLVPDGVRAAGNASAENSASVTLLAKARRE